MAKRYVTEKRYTIDFFTSGGHCYRTQGNCPYSRVKEARQIAKALGERVEVT